MKEEWKWVYNPPLDENQSNIPPEGYKSTYEYIVFDLSNYVPEPEPEKPVYSKQVMDGRNLYEVWTEGYAATGEHGTAFQLTLSTELRTKWRGDTFEEACRNAMKSLEWDMSYYDPGRNTYWACRFYDNEKDARKSFG
jgi:hypothetical protein